MFKKLSALFLNSLAHYTLSNRLEYFLLLIRIKPPFTIQLKPKNQPFTYDVYVISMVKSRDRRLFISKQFEQQEIMFKFTDATIGKMIAGHENSISTRSFYYLTSGSVGCWVSHYRVWQDIINTSATYSIVLEDDVIIEKKFKEKINRIFAAAPELADIIFLNTGNNYLHNRRAIVNDVFFVPYQIRNGAFGYILTAQGAAKLINMVPNTKVARGGIDSAIGALIRNSSINAYHLIQPLCWVDYTFGSATKN